MELEKALFRIHERILSQEHVQQAVRIVKLGFSALGLFMLCVFFYANSAHRNVQGCVGQIYNEFKDKQLEGKNLANDTVIFINVCNYNKTVQPEPMSYFNYTFYDPPVSDGKNGTADSTDLDPNALKDGNDKDTIIGDGDNNSKDPSNINNDVDPVDKTNQTYQLPSYINPKKKQLKSHCTELPRIQMEQAGISQTLYYPKELRAVRNITTAVMYIEPHCFASNSFADKIIYNVIGIEPVLINEIITNFRYGDLYMKNLLTDESWSWTTLQIISYTDDQISNFIYSFIRINLGLFYTSAVSSLYIKISIICSPVFILLIMYCVKCMGSQDVNITTLIQTFPYLGLYLHALRGQKTNELVKAFMKMMLVIYFVYLSALFIGSLILFHKSIPKGLDENFLALLAVLELLIMLFIRTRSSLKWFPRVCILLMSTFLYYTQNTIYGFYSALLQVIVFFIIAYFCMILEEFEIPGVTWNESYHYTPSTHRPRVLYFPIFNLGWYYDLPQLWTMFYPMYGRDHFTQAQLSLVDSNYILLNQTLENAERANNNDLGILIDFPQNRNNNNNNNNNENNDNNNNNNNNNNDQNNGGGQVGNENQEEGDNHHQDRQQNQDIEMQGGSLDNRRQQNAQTNQISQNQASDDFFSEENQNRSREQHLLTQEERALGNSQNSAEASGFYQGRGVMIGGGSSQAPYRSNNEDTSSGTKIGKDLTEYQKLE